ncbi:AAA family ATPase [Bradyrhizobium sp. MOS002]|uniref:AAA family ATPase n=1 Tax=Bradyrhizobium sp. MOS002 TaxID=2133947 RepID=UPI000D11C1C1|nr:AAA family ATPase [Bradyrhizobium sp. MOS002]PSO25197.1 hypothetical protein C7G41_30275 [Bradyrhizobium sp. MOS002]
MSDDIPLSDPRLTGLIDIREVTGQPDDAGQSAPSAEKTATLPFALWRDLVENDAAKRWLVHDLLGDGEFSAWFGEPGSGKSVLVEDLAIHVAADLQWHGRAIRHGAVLFVALERAQLVKRRAVAFRKKRAVEENLPFAVMQGVLDFRERSTADRVIQAAKLLSKVTGLPVVLIVIDTFNRALCGGDENSPKDVGAANAAVGRIQNAVGAHVLLTHHQPQDGNARMRGHGALLAAVDTTVHVEKAGDARTATVMKANDAEEGQRITFRLESVQVACVDGVETSAPVVVPVEGIGTKAAKQANLSNAARITLDALHDAVNEEGVAAPPSNIIPGSVRVVSEAQWRRYAYARGISGGGERANQKAFKTSYEVLLARKLVGCWEGQYWSASKHSG